ncbi:hypothetical protein [Oribacterium sp. P9]|uniref:hypothetical protein n=1 Tax=Oribacterium sp. P9 TaxID=3378068 RepID=UPI0039673142
MGFDYFYGRGTEPFAFLQVPRVLIEDERFADMQFTELSGRCSVFERPLSDAKRPLFF